MVIDLHNHSSIGSADSIVRPEELVDWARQMSLDAICITEHGNKKARVSEFSKNHDFLVLGGIEASTDLGDILVFGIDAFPRNLIRAADLRRFVEEAGGVMIAAHPFRYDYSQKPWLPLPLPLTLEEACRRPIFQLVDAMEAVNGFATQTDVDFCWQVSGQLGLKTTGGSDAHNPEQIGYCVTIFENEIRSEEDLVRELKGGRFRAEDRRPEADRKPTKWFI